MRKPKQKKDDVAFENTPEGSSFELFEQSWYSLPFGKESGTIDTKKLWWNLLSWSEQGNTYKNWMAAARTFYLKSPHQYRIHGTAATQQAIEFNITNQQVSEARGADYFIPEHLRNNDRGN
jgi:hypothetical protein